MVAKKSRKRKASTPRRDRHVVRHDGESYPIYTPQELAAMLNVQPDTLRRWRIAGKGPPFIHATRISIIYRKVDVDQWMANSVQRVQIVDARRKKKPKLDGNTQESNDVTQ